MTIRELLKRDLRALYTPGAYLDCGPNVKVAFVKGPLSRLTSRLLKRGWSLDGEDRWSLVFNKTYKGKTAVIWLHRYPTGQGHHQVCPLD